MIIVLILWFQHDDLIFFASRRVVECTLVYTVILIDCGPTCYAPIQTMLLCRLGSL